MISLMTLRIHMTDGTTFEFRQDFMEVDEVFERIKSGEMVHGRIEREDTSFGNVITINPACVAWTERFSGESEKGWKTGWTVIEAPKQTPRVEYVPIRMDTTPSPFSYPQVTCDSRSVGI